MRYGNTEITAPGKLILIGEYAIRHGAPGVVMAVDRLARLKWLSYTGDTQNDLVSRARVYTARLLGHGSPTRCSVNSSGFYHEGRKLGLGSSAAVTVTSVASVFFEAGYDINDSLQRQKLWAVSKEVHDEFQGVAGSGIDLAASVFGGYLVMDLSRKYSKEQWSYWAIPKQIQLVFCWTGSQSSTFHFVDAVDRWARTHPYEHSEMMSEMALVAEGFCELGLDSARMLEYIDRYGLLMERLGQYCSIPIFTGEMKKLRGVAADLGGAVKPSGAGGGDFLMAGFSDEDACIKFNKVARDLGVLPMKFGVCKEGVRVEKGRM